jgi:hypothetical protein
VQIKGSKYTIFGTHQVYICGEAFIGLVWETGLGACMGDSIELVADIILGK